jgi:hypothetical protein
VPVERFGCTRSVAMPERIQDRLVDVRDPVPIGSWNDQREVGARHRLQLTPHAL